MRIVLLSRCLEEAIGILEVDRVAVELVRAVDNIVSVVLVRLDPGLGSSGVHC